MVAMHRWLRPVARIGAVGLFAVLVLLLVWFRSAPLMANGSQTIEFTPIVPDRGAVESLAPFKVAGAWQLTGDPALVTGLSGLDYLSGNQLLAVGDRGSRLVIAVPRPGASGAQPGQFVNILNESPLQPGESKDAEAVVVDPASGRFWTALETQNRVVRYAVDGSREGEVDPPAMQHWPENVGSESMARLADDRFVIIGERRDRGRDRTFPMLLFRGDPLDDAETEMAHLAMPDDFKPVDAAPLPDGRMLVLGRALRFPFQFHSVITILDTRAIRPAGLVRAKPIAAIRGGALSDNYEGIAAVSDKDGQLKVWLVSDDNQQKILQSTKLLELVLDPADL